MATATERQAHSRAGPISPGSSSASAPDDSLFIDALRNGNQAIFNEFYARYYALMLAVAMTYVPDLGWAEEVIQETWLAAIAGLDAFESRCSFKNWILSILTRQAKKRAAREARTATFMAAFQVSDDGDSLWCFDDRGAWTCPLPSWNETPEEYLLLKEARDEFERAITSMPPRQQAVFRLRFIEGWTSHEVCELLGITPQNQRILLHRARHRLHKFYSAKVSSPPDALLREKQTQ